jgi:hypothetical protein
MALRPRGLTSSLRLTFQQKVGMSAAAQGTAPLSFSSLRTAANGGGGPNKYFSGCRIQPLRGATCTSVQLLTCKLVTSATCDFWTLKRNSSIKRYPSGVCPSPARETAPGFSLRGGGHPKNALVSWGPTPGPPNASVFWPHLVGRGGRERARRQAAGGAHDCARQGAP